MTQAAVPAASTNPVKQYLRGFEVLKETRLEYWGLQVINLIDSAAYMSLTAVAVVFLSHDFGFSDVHAGYIFSAFTMGVTVSLFFTGFLTDWLGIRRTLYISMLALLGLRILMLVVALQPAFPYRSRIAAGALIAMAPFIAMGVTMYQAGNRRFTTDRSRGAGFNLWYLTMNAGFFLGSMSVDLVRKLLHLPNAYILVVGIVGSALCVVCTYVLVRNEEQLRGPDEPPAPAAATARRGSPLEVAANVMREPVFWRFLVLVFLLLGVRAVFLYLHILWPKYWLRVIGPDAAIGTLQAVNPLLVAIGLIVLIPVLSRYSVYGMLTYGAIISALSLFVLAIPSYGTLTYYTSLACLLILTVGEVIWSPRLTEYTAAIAPKGQEGTYLGLSMIPWFAAKMTVSVLSGHMLNLWVPEYPSGEPILRDRLAAGEIPFWRTPSALWLLLGAVALAGPIIALVLRRWFTQGAHWEARSAAAAH